ncbi:MAG: PH domain-containing protein [Candidatus Omnitrophota bacterium]
MEIRPSKSLRTLWITSGIIFSFTFCGIVVGELVSLLRHSFYMQETFWGEYIAVSLLSSIIFSANSILYFNSIKYHIDGNKIIKKYGTFQKAEIVMPLSPTVNIDIQQGLLWRLFKIANLLITDPQGHKNLKFKIKGINNPDELKNNILTKLGSVSINENAINKSTPDHTKAFISQKISGLAWGVFLAMVILDGIGRGFFFESYINFHVGGLGLLHLVWFCIFVAFKKNIRIREKIGVYLFSLFFLSLLSNLVFLMILQIPK